MGVRDSKRMVAEDDPGFVRFWDCYPRRVSKKDARIAWAKLNPSPALVDQIVAALEWQIPANQWDGVKQDYAPYPASYLNAERWTDERRTSERRQQQADAYGHIPPCRTFSECINKRLGKTCAEAS
jgi:hypothetical protein